MANTYLKRTGTTTVNTYTFSAWIKLGTLSSANNTYQVLFSSGNQNILGIYGGPTASGYNALYHYNNTNLWWTNNLLRDPNSWYHVLAKVSGGTVTTYINGVQTSYATSTYSLGALETTTDKTCVGCYAPSASSFFRGSMSHVHFISGTAYDPSAFGETDTTTGEWKAKTSPSVTYGADGFFILKDGNGITDQSGEGNNFTLGGGTLTDLKDNPDNVFATLNPLNANIGATIPTLSMGNNRTSNNITNKMQTQYSTLAPSTGKFYCEVKATAGSVFRIGISSYNSNQAQGSSDAQNRPGQFSEGWGYDKTGTVYKTESSVGSYTAYNTGDIICIALDMTNKKLYFRRDANAWENSANPATGSNGIDISSISSGTGMAFGAGLEAGSSGAAYADFNFGNGYFGTTAITTNSGNGYPGAEGASKFNYTVPTGYSALNTKGLNT
jgi:hypothetical protein